MEWVELFKIIILKIDLAKAKLIPPQEYEAIRQELGININTSLSGSRAGQWIGGRIKNNKIFLFFRVSDPSKAKASILRLISNYDILSDAKIRMRGKKIKWANYTLI
jgi:methylglyoxal synthase